MDKRYELFCLADPLFYDSPNGSRAAQRNFAVADQPLPPRLDPDPLWASGS